jgi:glutamyl/glutaminyl-tRNA synthetase
MHIGGMRTALFVWLWARHNNGTFILRIDDTDQQRNVEAALAPIFRAFRWLGLNWDEGPEVGGPFGPYYQSQRTHLYQAAVDKLIAEGETLHVVTDKKKKVCRLPEFFRDRLLDHEELLVPSIEPPH